VGGGDTEACEKREITLLQKTLSSIYILLHNVLFIHFYV
jgi:hypothetical protein